MVIERLIAILIGIGIAPALADTCPAPPSGCVVCASGILVCAAPPVRPVPSQTTTSPSPLLPSVLDLQLRQRDLFIGNRDLIRPSGPGG